MRVVPAQFNPGDLQHEATRHLEDLAEARAENELLEQERERLAQQIEEMEKQAKASAPAVVAPLVEHPVEIFELDVDTDDDEAEEIVLLDDEATDPGARDPRKS